MTDNLTDKNKEMTDDDKETTDENIGNTLHKVVPAKTIAAIIIITLGIYAAIDLELTKNHEVKKLFPGIIGDTILKNNDTGISSIRDIILYDSFIGNITQGYKANYSGINGTVIIFIAQMQDYSSADKSLKDMVIRSGYNESNVNATIGKNVTVIKLPVKNPEVFVMQKNTNTTWHYTYVKSDKVYWIGFSKPDIEYQSGMLIEIYRRVDEKE